MSLFWKGLAALGVLLTVWSILWMLYRYTMLAPTDIKWPSFWPYSEWLINYQGGFVRRGLAGEVLHRYFPSPHVFQLNLLVFLVFSTITVGLAALARRVTGGWFLPLCLLLSPYGPFAVMYHNGFFYRKEMLFCLPLLLMAFVTARRVPETHRKGDISPAEGTLLAGLWSTVFVLVLVHESFVFVAAVPVLVMLWVFLSRRHLPVALFLSHMLAPVLVMLAALMLVARFHGTPEVAQLIRASLSPADIRAMTGKSAIDALGWDGAEAIRFTKQALTPYVHLWKYPLWLCSGSMVLFIWVGLAIQNVLTLNRFLVAVELYAATLLASLPLYVMGIDWGRWLVISHLCYAISFLGTLPSPAYAKHRPGQRVAAVAGGTVLLLWVWAGLAMHIPECCIEAYPSFPLLRSHLV